MQVVFSIIFSRLYCVLSDSRMSTDSLVQNFSLVFRFYTCSTVTELAYEITFTLKVPNSRYHCS